MFEDLDGEGGGVEVNEVAADIQHVLRSHAVPVHSHVIQDADSSHQDVSLQPAQLLNLGHRGLTADDLNQERREGEGLWVLTS